MLLSVVTVVSFFPGSLHRGCYVRVLGLRFALPQDVAASTVLTVAAAAIRLELDVAASLVPAAAAAAVYYDCKDVAASLILGFSGCGAIGDKT